MESAFSKCLADGRVVSSHKKQVISITINCLENQVFLRCHWQTSLQHRVSMNQVQYCQPKSKVSHSAQCCFVETSCFPNEWAHCSRPQLHSKELSWHVQPSPQSRVKLMDWNGRPCHYKDFTFRPLCTSLLLSKFLIWRKYFIVLLLLLLLLNIKGTNRKITELVSLSFPYSHL